jgi:hypothetical protein
VDLSGPVFPFQCKCVNSQIAGKQSRWTGMAYSGLVMCRRGHPRGHPHPVV